MFSLIHTPNGSNGFEIVLRNSTSVGLVVGTTTGNLLMNQWSHVAFVRTSATTAELYINGVLTDKFTFADPGFIQLDVANLGVRQRSNKEYYFTGSMDEVRVWNRALCQAEIQNNKDCELNGATQTGLLSLYHFNQGLAGGNNSPLSAPGAPTINSVTTASGSANLNFTAPASDGGSPVTSYTVTSVPGGFTATGNSSPVTVNGLTNGQSYTFTISATNSIGTSQPSASSAAVTPTGVPGAAIITNVTPGNTSATISFNPPASNGGLAITSYTVVSTPGGFTQVGTSSPITISGLTNGVSYTFVVKATNAAGFSTSASSNAVIPATVPGAPRITAVAPLANKVTVTFNAPTSNGGSAIINYIVTSNPGAVTASGSASPIEVTGLNNGTSYTFTAVAVNAIGTSASSQASTAATPTGPPLPPTILTATAGNAAATLTFAAPSSNGGSPITSYVAVSTPGSFQATVSSVTPITVSGLTNGQTYTFAIRAANALGSSAFSASSNAVTPATVPGAPAIQTVTPAANQATVTFTAPASNGGSTITSYTVTSNPGAKTATGSTSPITVTGLTNGLSYTFTVKATNAKRNRRCFCSFSCGFGKSRCNSSEAGTYSI